MAEMIAQTPAAASGKKLYARKSSGLVRTIGVFGAMVFGVHCISLSSSGLIPFSWVAGVWPGSSIIGVLTVAMFFCLFHAYTYAVIGATMPRSAADYTLASRTLSAPLAFAASWTLVIFSAMVAGSLIAWIPKTALPVLFRTMGIVMGNQSFVNFANWSVTPFGIVLIGTVCTIITFVLMILPTRTILRILEVGFFLGLLAWVVLYFQLGTAAKDAFPAAWDKFMGAGSYEGRIALAQQNGMVLGYIGVLQIVIQGALIRPLTRRFREGRLLTATIALAALVISGSVFHATRWLDRRRARNRHRLEWQYPSTLSAPYPRAPVDLDSETAARHIPPPPKPFDETKRLTQALHQILNELQTKHHVLQPGPSILPRSSRPPIAAAARSDLINNGVS